MWRNIDGLRGPGPALLTRPFTHSPRATRELGWRPGEPGWRPRARRPGLEWPRRPPAHGLRGRHVDDEQRPRKRDKPTVPPTPKTRPSPTRRTACRATT